MIDLILTTPPEGFFNEEVICGYTVTEKMKKTWAIQMEMVAAFDKLCKKKNIKYWGEGGTMLGAARHGGYVPWDDDIDIALERDDYDKFIESAMNGELDPRFSLVCYQTMPEEWGKQFARIMCPGTTMITTGKNKWQGIFIDIFPWDRTYEWYSLSLESSHIASIQNRRKKEISRIATKEQHEEEDAELINLGNIERSIYAKFNDDDKALWLTNKSMRLKEHDGMTRNLADIRDLEEVDFEYIKMPIPKNYDEALTRQYGDWRVPVIGKTIHKTKLLNPDKSFEEILEEREGEE